MTAEPKVRHTSAHAVRYHDENRRPTRVEWLVDNREAYAALVRSLANARESIKICQLAFDSDCVGQRTANTARRPARLDSEAATLLDVILEASATNKVNVEIILNATVLLDTAKPLREAIAGSGRDTSRVRVRGIARFPQLLHAKMVIVDGVKAFLMGSPFVNGYHDDFDHQPIDATRPRRELGGRPLHDVSISIEGIVVHELSELFATLWSAADGSHPERNPPTVAPLGLREAPNAPAKVVATLWPRFHGPHDPGSTGILDALLEGFRGAERFIYIEHQYLSSKRVVAALEQALLRSDDLQVVIVLNQNPDVTAYLGWQNDRLAKSGFLTHPRVGLFTLWSAVAANPSAHVTLNQVFVHSKVVIVDNQWAMVGSANLDGVSLDSYGNDFSSRLARRLFKHVRNLDVGLQLRDFAPNVERPGTVTELRKRLWYEHLGTHAAAEAIRSDAGCLRIWRERAAENVDMLNDGAKKGRYSGSFILPYSTRSTPVAQLRDIGVLAPVDLGYNPGRLAAWCSANWVRNMFQ